MAILQHLLHKYLKMIKNILLNFLFLFSFAVFAQIQGYNLNDTVDDFTVTDTNGNVHNLYTYTSEGKYVFIDFSFTTCGPCQATAPIFNEFHDKYGCNNPMGEIVCLAMFGVKLDDHDAEVMAFEETYGGSFSHAPTVSVDGGATPVDSDFNPAAYPTICLIDPDNKIINLDIWPVNTVADFEAAFPADFDPEPIPCNLSVSDQDYFSKFVISPNPLDKGDMLNLRLDLEGDFEMNIFNLLGEKIFHNNLTSNVNQLNVNLNPGTYLINVKNSKINITKKLIVK